MTFLSNRIEDIESEIVALLATRLPWGTPVSMQSKIVSDLGLDSAAIMDFVMDLEEKLGITVPLDESAEIETVGDLRKAVEALLRRVG